LTLRAAGGEGAAPGQRITLSLRPEDIALHQARPDGLANVMEGDVIETVYLGSFLDCRVRVGPHEVAVQIDHYEQLRAGQRVFLTFHPDHGLCLSG
jgi:ABC-type Fe3+/spermidine/putrescine transport system ATPase subunit